MSRNYSHRDFKNDAFHPVALGLGQVVLAWNDLLVSCSGLFGAIINIPNRLIPNNIWYAVASDRDQMEILRRLGSSVALGLTIPPKIRAEIKWILKHATDLINLRNELVHSPFVNSNGSIGPLHLGVHRKALTFERRDVLQECTWFFESAIILRNYVDNLEEALTRPDYTLPERPQLLERPNHKNQRSQESR